MPRSVLAIDQGTTNTKAVLVSETGDVLATASRAVPIRYPQPGWVEQDAVELWRSVLEAAAECLAKAGCAAPDAIGISNQRESAVAWDRRSGEPVGPCVSWQCRRTAPFCAELRRNGHEAMLVERTGLAVDPVCSASKMRWLLDYTPDGCRRAANGEIALGTVDSWLLWNLTGGVAHACDLTNASRTQLLNLNRLGWDAELLALFGIPEAALPALDESSHIYGETGPCGAIPAGLPIGALAGDSHAALFGHAIFTPGAVKATYGTGSSLMTITRAPSWSRGLATTVAWSCKGNTQYGLEGNIFATGGAVQWVGDFLGLPNPAVDAAKLAATVSDTAGVYLVPAFTGLGAPYWNDGARGTLSGLSRGTSAAHAARAAVEAVAFQISDVFQAMEAAAKQSIPELLADGGATHNEFLMQFQADILDRTVVASGNADVSAIGAAWLAGLATGVWKSLDTLSALPRTVRRFDPSMAPARRQRLLSGWRDAVRQALTAASAPPGMET
ncbi:MAG TPA: glycerol kinase GlpK [Verrucomicrobiae bacterium]|nr:glycerol kinase GlpK [Verrucomicrobiae bacterium]